MRLGLLVTGLFIFATPLPGQVDLQHPEVVTYLRAKVELERPLILLEPTLLILVDVGESGAPLEILRAGRALGDSIKAAVASTAERLGYIVEIRSTSYRGTIDQSSNARYSASVARGGGLVILRPGAKPSRLLPYLTPTDVAAAIGDAERLFRPSVPL